MLRRKLEANGNFLLKDSGITVMQLQIMMYITNHPGHTQVTEIANFFGVKHTSTLHVIRVLEDKQYIFRESIPHSRGKSIKLTDLGKQVFSQNETKINQMEEAMLKGFSQTEKNTLFSLLSRVNDNLDSELVERKKSKNE